MKVEFSLMNQNILTEMQCNDIEKWKCAKDQTTMADSFLTYHYKFSKRMQKKYHS